MKHVHLPFTLAFALMSYLSYGQNLDLAIDFETKNYSDIIFIDTISNPKNIWQIGKPGKQFFDSAYSGRNVLVTDTLNSYPINNTSRFILKFKRNGGPSNPSNDVSLTLEISTTVWR